jgi:hypothetical protein
MQRFINPNKSLKRLGNKAARNQGNIHPAPLDQNIETFAQQGILSPDQLRIL